MNKRIFPIIVGIFVILLVVIGILVFNSRSDEITTSDVSDRKSIDKLRNKPSTEELIYKDVPYTKDYSPEDRRLLIERNEGEKVLDMKLTSPYIVTGLPAGRDVKVAEFLLVDWEDSKISLVDTIHFYDINNDYEPIDKDYRFKWENATKRCVKENSSAEVCVDEINWVEFEFLNELPHENIKISLWANTEVLESVEWIPTINGFEILEWAAWTITDATYDGNNNVSSARADPNAFTLSEDGTKAYFGGAWTKDIVQFNCSVAYDLSTCINSDKNISTGSSTTGLDFGQDGYTFYKIDSPGGGSMEQWNMTTAWDITTATLTWDSGGMGGLNGSVGIRFGKNGSKLYTIDVGNVSVTLWDCSTSWNLSSCNPINKFHTPPEPRSAFFNIDGNISFIVDSSTDKVHQFNCSTAWDATSCISAVPEMDISTPHTDVRDIYFQSDGSSFYPVGLGVDSATKWIMVDTTDPNVNITYPFDFIDYQITDTNLTINWTVSDLHLDSCWGSFDEGTNNVSLTCGDLNITRNITSFTNDTFTIWANDTSGNIGVSSRTWIYKVFEVEQVFSSETLIGSTETFIMNMSLGSGETITEVNFNYNNTGYSATAVSLGGSEYNLSSTFIVPTISSIANISFFWIIDLESGQINTTEKIQILSNINVDDCSTFSTLIFNYTLIDEETQNKITNTTINETSIEIDLAIFDEAKTNLLLNFSQEFIDANPVEICLNVNLTESTIYAVDSTIKYEAVNYSIEYYNIQNFLMRNSTIPQHINLFDLKLADTTEFQITFKDSSFVAVEDALIQINRQYVAEGLFKTVEIPKTDSNGQTVAHLVEKEIVYNIIVLKEGTILGTFNNVIAFCEDVIIGSCFISLNALTTGEPSFEYDEDIGLFYDFDYNKTTRNLQFDFSTTDGSSKNVTLFGVKVDQLGNTSVCDNFLVSSSGTITCAIPISVGNETIIVSIFVDGDLEIQNYIEAGRAFNIGDAGYFLMFFLVLSLALMMTQSKTAVIIGVLIGFIASALFSFTQGGILTIGSSVIWLMIMGIILIYKLNKQGQT